MTLQELQHKETRLVEAMLSALDAREAAHDAGSSMLVYLIDLLVTRARQEIVDVRAEARLFGCRYGDSAAWGPPAREDGPPA